MKKILVSMFLLVFGLCLVGCVHSTYGYQFHFCVDGGNGTISIETSSSFNPDVKLCIDVEDMCELDCTEESYFVELNGGKNGSREITFIATPNTGYRVKEWLFNGEIVDGNKTNSFTAIVTSEEDYVGVIAVRFEENNHNEHTYTWYREIDGHIQVYTCGCPSEEGTTSHIDSDEDGYCDECKYELYSDKIEIGLKTKIMYYPYQSKGDELFAFSDEFGLTNTKYLIIDNSELYFRVFSKLPNASKKKKKTETELFSQEMADAFFENNVIVLHLRFISGTMAFVPINYYYNVNEKTITMEYINDVPEVVLQVFLGNTIDIITIPKEYYNKINK